VDFQLKSEENGYVNSGIREDSVSTDLDLTEVPSRRYLGMQLSRPVVGGSHPESELGTKCVKTLPIHGICETRPNLHELEIILLGVPFSVFQQRTQVGPALGRIRNLGDV